MHNVISALEVRKIILLLIMSIALVSCNNTEVKTPEKIKETKIEKVEKIKVMTSIIPLASITNYIGWDLVEAKSLVPSWVSPHWFDLKPNQMVELEKSDLIVFLDLDHIDWFLNKAIENKENILAVKKWIEFLESSEDHHDHGDEHMDEHWEKHDEHEHDNHKEEHNEEKHEESHDKHEEEHSTDPHIWGNSANAYIIAKSILDQLANISPKNKEVFEKNLELFKLELDTIKKEFEEKRKDKKESDFIVFHDAYNYLFSEFNIKKENKHIFRKNILNEPNSSEMKKLIDEIKEEWIKVAFKEPQLDASNLKKTAYEHNLQIFVLNPLWIDESKDWYINNYKNNLNSLSNIYE